MDPVLNTLTVVNKEDAMFVAFPDTPAGYMLTQEINEKMKELFASPAQVDAIKSQMDADGWDTSKLELVDSSTNYNFSPRGQKLVRQKLDGPWMYSFSGPVVLPNGRETVINLQIGQFINTRRIKRTNNPLGVPDFGDHIGVHFSNPNMPIVVWTDKFGAEGITGNQ